MQVLIACREKQSNNPGSNCRDTNHYYYGSIYIEIYVIRFFFQVQR